jgi:hypothetical protein
VRRVCATAGTLVVAATVGAALSVGSAAASAAPTASAPAKTVTCSSLAGNLNSAAPATFALAGCTGNTGGSGSAQGKTITWKNGLTTYLTSAAFTPSGQRRQGNCGAQSNKWTIADSVGGDSTGSIRDRGRVSAQVCILNESPDPWSLAPGSVLTLR